MKGVETETLNPQKKSQCVKIIFQSHLSEDFSLWDAVLRITRMKGYLFVSANV